MHSDQLDALTPALADMVHLASIHRRRVREGRSSEVDRMALRLRLHRVQRLWPIDSSQRDLLHPRVQTILRWIEQYIENGAHANDLDAILQRAFSTPQPRDAELVFLAAWVSEVNAADAYVIVKIAEHDVQVSIEEITTYLPWWLLAEDAVFQIGLAHGDAELLQRGEDVPVERWQQLIYEPEQLLDDDAFLFERIAV